jgi:hypothetical protein
MNLLSTVCFTNLDQGCKMVIFELVKHTLEKTWLDISTLCLKLGSPLKTMLAHTIYTIFISVPHVFVKYLD